MNCRIAELKNKQVVCVKNGCVLGYVYDIEFNTASGSLTSIVIPGRPRLLGLFGHEEDIVIPWSEIEVIGRETVLVSAEAARYCRNTKGDFLNFSEKS